MYTKTTWVDNTTPIDKDNLNKIEQGIYDNSIVVDAVTNTLNPTDTETYKTAELTEGQITDVIGVSDIVIKGDTEQDGEPTPSAPVDVNVVSGSNVINTSNKNLFIPTLKYNNRDINQNNCIVSLDGDEFTFTATGNDMYFGHIGSTGTTFVDTYGVLYKVLNNKTIRFTITNTTFNKNYIVKYDKDKKILGYQQFNSNSGTITFTDDVKYYSFRIGYGSAVAGTTYKTKIQVELGSTATTYEPHQGKELPLDLPVENLFDGVFRQGTHTSTTSSTRICSLNIMEAKNGESYTLSTNLPSTFKWKIMNVNTNETTNVSVINDTSYTSSNSVTVNCSNNGYLKILVGKTDESNIAPSDISNYNFQVEKASKANTYTPYGTNPIELCKIGNYQDYFYKSGSKWYLHKEMTFETRTLEDNWQTDTIPQSNPRKFVRNNNHTYIVPANNDTIVTAVCNYPLVSATNTSAGTASGVAIHPNGSFYISADVYNNLNSSPIKMYIPLITPIDTEITDTTLISQLEAIYNAPLYEQTNITQTNNDLPMVLDITACKDNINGIKAFIRK